MTPEQYQQAKQDMKRHRVRLNFEQNYAELGGAEKLMQMADEAKTTIAMGKHFGMSSTRIGIIIESVLGMTYSQYLIKHKVRRPGVWRKPSEHKRGAKPREGVDGRGIREKDAQAS